MAGTQVRGIASRFDGTCPLCGGQYQKGDVVEKISESDTRRGHIQCVVNANNGRPAQMQSHPGGQTYQQPPPINHGSPGGYTPPAQPPQNGALQQIDVFNSAVPAALWQLFEGLTAIAQGAMKASVAVEQIANIVDPHHTKKTGRAQ